VVFWVLAAPWQRIGAPKVQELDGTLSTCARRDVDVGEVSGHYEAIGTDEGAACCADAALTIGCERDVGYAGVTAIEGPFGLAMADDEDSGSCHGRRRDGVERGM
jgi:hypothetical protein